MSSFVKVERSPTLEWQVKLIKWNLRGHMVNDHCV